MRKSTPPNPPPPAPRPSRPPPHLDALDPQQAAIAWAEGKLKAEIDPVSDRALDPETETAATLGTERPPKFVMSDREKKRARPPRQRQRQRVRGGG
jgi:hypothetical protein